MPIFDDRNVKMTTTMRVEAGGATLSLRRLNAELTKTQLLLKGISGGALAGAGSGVILGSGVGRKGTGAAKKGILGQAAAISVLGDSLRGLSTAAKIGAVGFGGFLAFAGKTIC